MRRGFGKDTLTKLRQAYRYLLQSKLNATQALQKIESDPALACPEVEYLLSFIRTAPRGVILKRGKVTDDEAVDG
jgi:acyl-[acyl carrier protein]--UDP-N-acetylglucosamine O-acyltransferase